MTDSTTRTPGTARLLTTASMLALAFTVTPMPGAIIPAHAEDCFLDTDNNGTGDSTAGASSAGDNARLACGRDASATGANSTAIGSDADASGNDGVAVGGDGNDADAFGARASQSNASAFGTDSTASAVNATAIGANTVASGDNSTVVGAGASASGNDGVAVGGDGNDGDTFGARSVAEQRISVRDGLDRIRRKLHCPWREHDCQRGRFHGGG